MVYTDHIENIKLAIKQINNSPMPTIQLTKCRRGYVCPICGNGSGNSGTGITKKFGRWKCFKCGYNVSNLDMYMLHNGLDVNNKRDVATATKHLLNVTPIEPTDTISHEVTKPLVNMCNQYRQWLNNALDSREVIAYWESRGITVDTMKQYQLGFMRDNYNVPRVVIPITKYSYNARRIDNVSDYKFIKHGPSELYFERRLINATAPVFVVESEIDALSIVQSGFNSVAIGGVGNTNKLIEAVNKHRPTVPILLACDNDEPGQKANKVLHDAIPKSKMINPYGQYKDANEMLVSLGYDEFTKEWLNVRS